MNNFLGGILAEMRARGQTSQLNISNNIEPAEEARQSAESPGVDEVPLKTPAGPLKTLHLEDYVWNSGKSIPGAPIKAGVLLAGMTPGSKLAAGLVSLDLHTFDSAEAAANQALRRTANPSSSAAKSSATPRTDENDPFSTHSSKRQRIVREGTPLNLSNLIDASEE